MFRFNPRLIHGFGCRSGRAGSGVGIERTSSQMHDAFRKVDGGKCVACLKCAVANAGHAVGNVDRSEGTASPECEIADAGDAVCNLDRSEGLAVLECKVSDACDPVRNYHGICIAVVFLEHAVLDLERIVCGIAGIKPDALRFADVNSVAVEQLVIEIRDVRIPVFQNRLLPAQSHFRPGGQSRLFQIDHQPLFVLAACKLQFVHTVGGFQIIWRQHCNEKFGVQNAVGDVVVPLARWRDSLIKPNIVPVFLHRTDNGEYFALVLVRIADKGVGFAALIGAQDFFHFSRPFCRIWIN